MNEIREADVIHREAFQDFVIFEARPWYQQHLESRRPTEEEILSVMSQHLPLEVWDEDRTPLRRWLFLAANSYHPALIFDLPPAPLDRLETNFLVSPKGSFAYQNRVLPAGRPLFHQGPGKGMAVFNGDVVIPMLIDMKLRAHTGEPFSPGTDQGYRVKWGAAWMSLTPSEMLTQRPGIQKAQGRVVIGGLGLGWLLRKVCEKESVEQVIVVEKSKELLDWYGHDLCKRQPKVSDVICDDIYNQIGRHGGKTIYLLDIWLLYSDAQKDHRLRSWKRKLNKRLWAWGM
jgi:hypothetical protein